MVVVAQQLRALAAFSEDLGSTPSTHMVAQTTHNSRSRGYKTLFCPPWAPGIHLVNRHACKQNLYTKHKFKKILKKRIVEHDAVHFNLSTQEAEVGGSL